MSLAQALSTYFNLNLLVLIALLGLSVFSLILKKIQRELNSKSELKLHYALLSAVMLLSLLHPFLPHEQIFTPPAKLWSAASIKNFPADSSAPDKGGYLSVPSFQGESVMQADRVADVWIFLSVILFLSGGVFIFRDLRSLLSIKSQSYLVRHIGQVRVFLNDEIQMPFSFWVPRGAHVVIPSSLLSREKDYKIAIQHELQHHRQRDTLWVYIIWLLRLVCILNPAVHIWSRWISEIQEFACDETLIDRQKVNSQNYARCLVEVAQNAIQQKNIPVCATGLTFLIEGHLLKRRIKKMLGNTQNQIKKSVAVTVGTLLVAFMALTACASNSLVQDKRVTLEQAQKMAAKTQGTDFPVVVNESVLRQLNRYVGTPEGREFMKASLERMQNYKATVGQYIKKYNVPEALMAVPIIESGYQNLSQEKSATSMKSAGLWQFIPATARNYGLKVDSQTDERLNVDLNTDAAMRLLTADYKKFNDWSLSLMAYNMGEKAVEKGIAATGSKDPWALISKGYEGDKDYLAKFSAAVLIMQNPEIVK